VPGSPGAAGTDGTNGTDGVNAYTTTTADITLPAAAGPVVAISTFADISWAAIGQVIFISDGTDYAHFRILTIPTAQSATLTWLDFNGDAGGTSVIGSGAKVSPAGTQPPLSAALPTALTDNTGGTASNTIAAGVALQKFFFQHVFIGGTSAAEPVTNWTPGFAFEIEQFECVTSELLVGAGGSRVFNIEIGTTDLTGGVLTVPIANSAVGTLTAATAITGANTGSAADNISIELANGGTEFTAGSITLILTIRNLDLNNAIASLADHVNDLITSLT